jgi:hypothetical protein
MAAKVYKPEYTGLYYFDTFTFTTLGTSGRRGPESTKTYTNAPWRDGDFSIVDGQQQWTVPASGTYSIEAAGAYGATPGRVVSGEVFLSEGQTLSLLVGQQPTPLTSNVVDNLTVGGGGGTFVVSDGTPLIVASGGDGTGGHAASFSPYGSGNGQNGGGYFSNGLVTSATFQFLKPAAYVDGGFGNIYINTVVPEEGGFGGGQSPVASGISGGGGYTGSPGDGVSGATCYGAGTITDLGASSNHMGYVTVSLIDPAPINLTLWSWDDESPWDNLDSFQANVYTITWSESLGIFVTSGFQAGICISSNDAKKWYNHAIPWPYSRSPIVAADDKPILVLGRNTSSDGITWYLNDLPYTPQESIEVTNTVYVNKMFISTAAPGYYTPYNGMYTSTDGYAWTFISSELISVKAYGSSMYVGTTNTQSDPNIVEQVVYSTDLITWNYTSTYVYDVTFAKGIFIGFNGDGSVISSDGISWTLYPYMFAISYSDYSHPVRQVVFGNDLFMVVSAGCVYTSPDGMNWTFTKFFSQDNNISVAYSPSKQFFMFVPTAGVPVATLEGKYFTSLSEQIKYPIKGCAYSKGLNVLVVIARSYSYSSEPIYIYTSSDNGETLLETSILYFGYQEFQNINILWSDDFYSFFIYVPTDNSGILIFTSSDGMTWTRQNDYVPEIPNYNYQGFNPVWYKEKNWFRYNSFYSPDGINWSYLPDIPLPPSPPAYIGSKVWSPEFKLFVGTSKLYGISSSFDVYVSTDGINWSTVYTAFMFTVGFVGVVWSPELKKFYIYAAGYPTAADSLYLFESPDGYDWNKRVVPKVYTLDYASGFYWFSGFDRFVVQSFQNFKGITFSTKAIKQF